MWCPRQPLFWEVGGTDKMNQRTEFGKALVWKINIYHTKTHEVEKPRIADHIWIGEEFTLSCTWDKVQVRDKKHYGGWDLGAQQERVRVLWR